MYRRFLPHASDPGMRVSAFVRLVCVWVGVGLGKLLGLDGPEAWQTVDTCMYVYVYVCVSLKTTGRIS